MPEYKKNGLLHFEFGHLEEKKWINKEKINKEKKYLLYSVMSES